MHNKCVNVYLTMNVSSDYSRQTELQKYLPCLLGLRAGCAIYPMLGDHKCQNQEQNS